MRQRIRAEAFTGKSASGQDIHAVRITGPWPVTRRATIYIEVPTRDDAELRAHDIETMSIEMEKGAQADTPKEKP